MPIEQSYYIIIPGSVRGDDKLDIVSKLLFGEIAAKCNLKGYCWATNEALAEIMGCSVRSLQRSIKALQSRGHVSVEVIRDEMGTTRRIWIREAKLRDDEKNGTTKAPAPHAKTGKEGGDAGGAHTTLREDYSNDITLTEPIIARASEHEGVRWPWETETFWRAWAEWRDHKQKQFHFRYKTRQSEQYALDHLQKLADDSEATAHAILRQSMANGWKGFFHLKTNENESNRGTTAGGRGKTGTSDARIDALRRW